MQRKITPALFLAALLPLAACNSNPSNPFAATVPTPAPTVPSTSVQDQNFAMQAAASDMFEVQSSQLALQKSRNPAVRRYAQMMIDAHTRTSDTLKTLAGQKGAAIPSALDPMQQQKLSVLEAASRSFDREYLSSQSSAHQDAVQVFRTEVSSGTDPDMKAFAQQTLPDIEQHLAMARRIRG